MALIFVNIIVDQIWLSLTIIGLLMCVSVPGVVHAHPGQNLLKRLILRVVTMFDLVFVMTLLLGDVTHFSIWLLNCFVLSYPSSASIQMDHLTPSGQFDMSFLYWFLGALTSSKPPEKWTMKKTWKKNWKLCPMAYYQPPYLPNGGDQWLWS